MEAVVFDFDGVIGQSMEQHAEAYRRLLAPLGIEVTDRAIFLLEGARSESVIRDLAQDAGIDVGDIEELADRKQAIFEELGRPGVYEGVADVVRDIQDRTATAVVTGTRKENLESIIPELLPRFDAVLAQDSYSHDKPHPEPFVNAARELGVPPERCIAIENATRGVQSAKAAGYGRVIAISTTLPAEDLAEADDVVDDHEALHARILEHLG